mgnify:CR=1 FL=1
MTALLLSIFAPVLEHIFEIAITAIIGAGAWQFRRWTGREIEARHREALHSALMTGARIALQRGLKPQAAVDMAIGYARTSVPDAIRELDPNEAVLTSRARAVLEEAQKTGADLR